MTKSAKWSFDPKLDLKLEREIDVPRELVWAAWTQPEHIREWFTPRPWTVSDVEIDLRPGGIFRTVMRSPEGEEFPNLGCILEAIPMERFSWTDALLPGFRPATSPTSACHTGGAFTAVISFESIGKKTRYTAIAIHADESSCKKHLEMGFHDGWGTALDQLIEHTKTM